MEKLKIYRVEHPKTKKGMYKYVNNPIINIDFYDWDKHPSPDSDPCLEPYYREHCHDLGYGFNSIKQLKEWICSNDQRKFLKDNFELIVSVFYAEGVHGERQSIYLFNTRCVNVETLSLTEI